MNRYELLNPMYTKKVKKAVQENYRVRTLEIDHALDAKPGQFLMVWVPGKGERPMSIGNSDPLTISVANVGEVSSQLCSLEEGDWISYRGPFGNPFRIPEKAKRILCIGGGYGVVPMYFLARRARESGVQAFAVIGGRSDEDIVWEKQLFAVCEEAFITTDDGSKGKEGTVMVEVEWLIKEKGFDAVYACGPERMMEAVARLCKEQGTHCQLSIERYMKCGVGVCGSCGMDGKLCCTDGPVFTGEEALASSDFGKKRRDPTGRPADI